MNGSYRRGFTLVELLVVTGLMAGLLGLVLTVGRPSGRSQVGQTLQNLSSAVISTQTRALGKDAGAALLLEPGTNGMVPHACNTMLSGDVQPFVTGSCVTGMPPADLALASTTVSLSSPDNGSNADLQQGYRIRFSGTAPATPASPWFRFVCTGDPTTCTVSLRTDANQFIDNTVWPRGAPGVFLRYEVSRYPQKGPPIGEPVKQAAIDLRYSGVGDTGVGDYAALASTNANKGVVAICFDRDGRLDSVMQYGSGSVPSVQPLTPTAPLYLLVATVADIQDGRSLQSASSRWLAIAPSTGRVSIAANISVAGTTPADIAAARANARLGVTQGVGR
jgi:prepilin-type N-terminal cleavage/methylation domain-containing protein